MGLPVFEIAVGFEVKLATFLRSHGYEFLPKGNPTQLEGVDAGIEQYWSVISDGKEVAVLDIVDTNKGKKILIWGPLRDRRHKAIYKLLKEEIVRFGAMPLDDFNSAFETPKA